ELAYAGHLKCSAPSGAWGFESLPGHGYVQPGTGEPEPRARRPGVLGSGRLGPRPHASEDRGDLTGARVLDAQVHKLAAGRARVEGHVDCARGFIRERRTVAVVRAEREVRSRRHHARGEVAGCTRSVVRDCELDRAGRPTAH